MRQVAAGANGYSSDKASYLFSEAHDPDGADPAGLTRGSSELDIGTVEISIRILALRLERVERSSSGVEKPMMLRQKFCLSPP